jgi:hypothetical protein
MFPVRYEMNSYILFIRNFLSSKTMLHKDYDCKGSVAKKITGREPQRA